MNVRAISLPLLVLASLACAARGGEQDQDQEQERAAASASVEAEPEPDELLVGRWRLIREQAPKVDNPVTVQGRRLLSLAADGRFTAENYMGALDGDWQLDGELLTLGDAKAELVSVDAERLVLVEDVPEIYLRGSPPWKSENTYRRISERELGPMLGRELVSSTPQAGSYSAAYDYGMSKYPTMEISISESIDGRATLELGADGTAKSCVGVSKHGYSSISKYASDDGEHHSNTRDNRWLLGWEGTWTRADGHATVTGQRAWYGSCAPSDPSRVFDLELELVCEAIAANEVLPVTTLACRIAQGPSMLEEIALNPADTERSGPYTLQSDPMGHISTDHGRPWLMLGAAPGLQVESEDERRGTPSVSFAAGPVEFIEKRYVNADP